MGDREIIVSVRPAVDATVAHWRDEMIDALLAEARQKADNLGSLAWGLHDHTAFGAGDLLLSAFVRAVAAEVAPRPLSRTQVSILLVIIQRRMAVELNAALARASEARQ